MATFIVCTKVLQWSMALEAFVNLKLDTRTCYKSAFQCLKVIWQGPLSHIRSGVTGNSKKL